LNDDVTIIIIHTSNTLRFLSVAAFVISLY